jgi:hypothetical protein
MARIDWLGDMGTGFGKAVLGVALDFGMFFASCPRWQGETGEDGGAQRTARIERQNMGKVIDEVECVTVIFDLFLKNLDKYIELCYN